MGSKEFLRNRGLRGRCKIADKFRSEVYKIVDADLEKGIYQTEPEDGFGVSKWVNRTELQPWKELRVTPKSPKQTKRKMVGKSVTQRQVPTNKYSTTSSSDDEMYIHIQNEPVELESPSETETEASGPSLGSESNVSELSSSDESSNSDTNEPDIQTPRRTTRTTAGKHRNPYHQPRSACP